MILFYKYPVLVHSHWDEHHNHQRNLIVLLNEADSLLIWRLVCFHRNIKRTPQNTETVWVYNRAWLHMYPVCWVQLEDAHQRIGACTHGHIWAGWPSGGRKGILAQEHSQSACHSLLNAPPSIQASIQAHTCSCLTWKPMLTEVFYMKGDKVR